jgi:uncharacterized RDD family membrane protein YckC
MRCPKCHYISYDDAERCRNCGYDLSAVPARTPEADLPMRDHVAAEGPPSDFDLQDADGPGRRAAQRAAGPASPLDLPLFHEPVPGVDDTPLIKTPATPRAPLSVRRSTEVPRARPSMTPVAEAPSFEFPGDEAHEKDAAAPRPAAGTPTRARPVKVATRPARSDAAPLGRRLGAGLIDLAIMAGIDATVVAFTLRLTGLAWGMALDLPLLPLAGFLAILNGGYLVGFTAAAGQTVGKMATGVRVVGEATYRVPLGAAVVRAVAFAVSVLPAGLGLLPILFSADGRAVHDRLSATRVTRA